MLPRVLREFLGESIQPLFQQIFRRDGHREIITFDAGDTRDDSQVTVE